MTKYLVSGYIGFDNFGDEAIASVLVGYLKEINAEKITLISSNPEKTSAIYNVDSVKMFNFFKAVYESDVLISGGGSLLQDITSLKSLLYYLSIIMLALVLDKKVVIFAQGFTPFRTKIGEILTKFVLKHCHLVSVRDIESQKMLEKMGIFSELVTDPVYGIKIPKLEKSGIGIQLRNFPTLNDSFLDDLAENIKKNFREKNVKLFSLQDSIDMNVLKNFSNKLTQKGVNNFICHNLSTIELINEISSLEYLIGMRFHSSLVAAMAGVKILGINYDKKVETLAKNIGFPILEMNEKDMIQAFNQLLSINVSEYKLPRFKFPEI